MKNFADAARYYDILYRDKDYLAEAEFIYSLIGKQTPNSQHILELGAGTGGHAQCLAELGMEVHGVELSPQMLAKARSRQQALPAAVSRKLEFSLGDARTIRLGRTFDAVIALFHVMSYQVSNADIRATFRTATEHLRPGGVFIFDYWYGPAVLTERPSVRVKRVEDETVSLVRLVEPVMYGEENVVEVNYQFFVQDKKSGAIETFKECHRMRYLFLPELAGFFAEAGLTPCEHSEWLTGNPPGFNTWGVYSIGRK